MITIKIFCTLSNTTSMYHYARKYPDILSDKGMVRRLDVGIAPFFRKLENVSDFMILERAGLGRRNLMIRFCFPRVSTNTPT